MTITELSDIAKVNSLDLDEKQLVLLQQYAALLKEKNQVVNLISRKDEDNILSKHILQSLTLAMPLVTGFAIPQNAVVFDLGTGGGLPGIPLKIARPDNVMTLCDSIAKKIKADEEMIATLKLDNISAITSRSEELPKKKEYRKQYDVIVSRAVAKLDELAAWSIGLIKPGATLLALKGGDVAEEIERTRKMYNVKIVTESLLILNGFDEFALDEKKVVCVQFH